MLNSFKLMLYLLKILIRIIFLSLKIHEISNIFEEQCLCLEHYDQVPKLICATPQAAIFFLMKLTYPKTRDPQWCVLTYHNSSTAHPQHTR